MRQTKLSTKGHFHKATSEGIIQILLETHKLVQYIVQPHVSWLVTIQTLRYLQAVDEKALQAVEDMIAKGKITPNTKYTEREIRCAVLEEIDPEGYNEWLKEQNTEKPQSL